MPITKTRPAAVARPSAETASDARAATAAPVASIGETEAPRDAAPAAAEPVASAEPAAAAGARFAEAVPVDPEPDPQVEIGPVAPVDAVLDSLTVTQQDALAGLETARSAMVEGIGRVQREIADFVSGRIRQDMETQAALLRCKTLEDVRGVQTAFFRTAMDMYSAEATRLMKLGGDIVAKSVHRGAA